MSAKTAGASSVDRLAIEQQVQRLVASPGLQHSEALCLLLRYLVKETLDKPHEHIKEYQIALDVLGRPDSFDPHIDSAVRVQTSRLRTKLIDYYTGAGSEDRVRIEVPKGSYAPVFHERPEPVSGARQSSPRPVFVRRGWIGITAGLAVLLALIVLAQISPHPRAAKSPGGDSLARFWRGFLSGEGQPLVVFSNTEFVGRPDTGLRYYAAGRDAPDAIFDHYTGVGEVLSVHELDQLETQLGREFRFQIMTGPPRQGDLAIVNLHPAPGEPAAYFASKQLPIKEDYAVVELLRDAAPAHSILLLAGTTTFGTEGAAEFVCNADRIHELLPQIRGSDGLPKDFTALLQVKVDRGVPITTRLVALRTR